MLCFQCGINNLQGFQLFLTTDENCWKFLWIVQFQLENICISIKVLQHFTFVQIFTRTPLKL